MSVKSKGNTTQEEVTELLKAKINATEIKVARNKYRVLNNGKIIGTNTKQKIEALETENITMWRRIESNRPQAVETHINSIQHPRRHLLTNHRRLLNQNPDLGMIKEE